ncbi:MAG TPA: hypothetical protein VN962_03285, partial [Polyangia bacterium]|nr:hypothetical protein [Polyangia bacterium]
ALAKEPADRFPSMEDFRKALTGEVKLPVSAVTTGPAATQIAPAHPSSGRAATTLSSATSELDDSVGVPRTRKLALIGGAAVAAVVLIVVLIPKKHAPPPAPAVTASAPAQPPAPRPPAPESPAKVTIRFETDPPGAHVIDQKGGHDLGAVPVEVQLAKGGDPSKYTLRLAGYRDVPLTATPTADRTMHVVLDKVPAAAPAPAAANDRHRAAHHSSSRRRSVIDEDGLATPSF